MKNVLITGGASGMGRATALKLKDNGYHVFSLDIKKSEEVDNITQIIADVTSEESLKSAFEIVSSKVDSLDAVINFAGIIMMNSLFEISEEEYVKIFNVNVFGAFRVNKIFLPLLIKNKGKIIVTTSELASEKILPFNAIYSISKKSLDAYTEGLRMEANLLGIKVITLRPGAVSTGLIDNSNKTLDNLEANTLIYKNITTKFKKIVDSEQGKTIPAEKVGALVYKILSKKHTKLIYSINTSFKLKILNFLPERLRLSIIKNLLK